MAEASDTMEFTISWTRQPYLDRAISAFRMMADIGATDALLRRVVSRSIVQSVSKRFEAAKGTMPRMVRGHKYHLPELSQQRRERIADRIQGEIAAGHKSGMTEGRKMSLTERWAAVKAGRPMAGRNLEKSHSGGGYKGGDTGQTYDDDLPVSQHEGLSTGLFRSRMNLVLSALRTIHTAAASDGASVGMGAVSALRAPALYTPSFTEWYRKKTPDTEARNLWLHLEMGTGMTGSPVVPRTSKYRIGGSRQWRYGRWVFLNGGKDVRSGGIVLWGSPGGHFLRTPAGQPYPGDQERLANMIFSELERLVRKGGEA